jgi:hypothetical protein
VKRFVARALAMAAALTIGAVMPPGSPAQTPQPSPPASSAAPNQVASVTLARGIKSASYFGSGAVTPVDPTTVFVNTDVPYVVVRIKALAPETTVALRLSDPAGVAYTVQAKIPPVRGHPKNFDFAGPLYILGTDLENDFGTWHVQVFVDGRPVNDTAFQWNSATALSTQQMTTELSDIQSLVDEDPTNPDLHWRYGAALALFHQDQAAIRELQNAIRLDPHYALYHITLGRIYEREGRTADARREFQTALAIHGSNYDAVFSGWAQAHLTKLQGR